MDPKKKNARAGYGIAEYEVTADGREKFLSARYGKVNHVPPTLDVPRGDEA